MRCEGYIKPGTFMTFGPRYWRQCEAEAIVMIEFEQGDEGTATLPGCAECWQRCKESEDIKILSVAPINANKSVELGRAIEAPFCSYCGAYHFPHEKTLCVRR